MLYFTGKENKEWRQRLRLSLFAEGALAGIDPSIICRFENEQYSPPPAAQRQLQLTLQTIDVLQKALAPAKIDTRDITSLKALVSKLENGEFQGFARLASEKMCTIQEIKRAGEEAPAEQF